MSTMIDSERAEAMARYREFLEKIRLCVQLTHPEDAELAALAERLGKLPHHIEADAHVYANAVALGSLAASIPERLAELQAAEGRERELRETQPERAALVNIEGPARLYQNALEANRDLNRVKEEHAELLQPEEDL